jgi:hypothetical protein
LLSRLAFGSFLSYSPRGTTKAERDSAGLCKQIKADGYVRRGDGEMVSAIAYSVSRLRDLRDEIAPDLADLLAGDVLLVPAPGHAPLPPQEPNAQWIARRICGELCEAGFARGWEPLLERVVAVPQSSTASQERRPRTDLKTHYDSLRVDRRLGDPPARITLVDDFITKGNTLLAGASRLKEAYPDAAVRGFALVRTQYESGHEGGGKNVFRAIVDPISSTVTRSRYGAWRRDE